MRSIRHNPAALPLPDFRNFGVMLRILLGVNLLALVAALVQSSHIGELIPRYIGMAAWVQPLLLFNLLVLVAANPLLQRLPRLYAQGSVVFVAVASAALLLDVWRFLGFEEGGWRQVTRVTTLAALVAGTMLYYFLLRARAFSPALSDARLQALTARIRPHFLFNSLNAVLSLIRSEPRRAETALEELADLFRMLMRDHRDLHPLADEIALCRQYLDLEKLRLGERLNVEWEIADVPNDLEVPPLMLQPLLENAVYHGIEPSSVPGTVRIRFSRVRDELHIDLVNPCRAAHTEPGGNRMALNNIRERLALYYDLEARLETKVVEVGQGKTRLREYHVHIVLPCRGE